jgi:elongation of very long chain fatty acids protein 6
MFEFERSFDHVAFHSWMKDNWTLAFWFSTIYVLAISAVSRHMANRSPYELRVPLVAWNAALAAFSIAGAVRMISELVDVLRRPDGGWTESICNPSFYVERPTAFWAAAFTLSKVML